MKTIISRVDAGKALITLLLLSGFGQLAFAGITDIADSPLASGVGSEIALKPNIAFVFDDSGSMDEENMPDGESTNRSRRCWGWHKYNTLFYNPNYTYKPPFKLDGAVYSDGYKRFPDASFTAARQDGFFPNGGYTFGGSSSSNTATNLSTLSNLTPNAVSCAAGNAGSPATATITSDGNLNSRCYRVTSITVNTGSGNVQLLNAASVPSSCTTNADTLGQRIADSINDRSDVTGFSASYSNSSDRVTITAPVSLGNFRATPSVNFVKDSGSGNESFTVTAFSGYTATVLGECDSSPSKYYYSTHKTDLESSSCEDNSNYSIVTRASDIAAPGVANGSTAALTNYANWYTYYRNRAKLMKAATAEAFKDLQQNKYRVGLFFLNSVESGSAQYDPKNNDLKIDDFSGEGSSTHRYTWFDRLYKSRANGNTPTRGALSRMGRMYAGQISGWDPVQYSCQQNFTILSTDGYWNTGNETTSYGPKKINGTTSVGHQDGAGTSPVSATARITIDTGSSGQFSNSKCYETVSLTVDTGTGPLELLNTSPVTASCSGADTSTGRTTRANAWANSVVSSINAKSSATGFTASYDSGNRRITITAPTALGDLTATPQLIWQKTAGTGNAGSPVITAFSGGSGGTSGAPRPQLDALGASNTLADIAYYYYNTDLRTEALGNCSNTISGTTYNNLCKNNVLGGGEDNTAWQHMTTFTLGLGVSGRIKYETNYKTAANTADTQYFDIRQGTADWPDPITDTEEARIDDLWHAAVNGHGTYYAASNAETLKGGILDALNSVQARVGSSSAAATSSLEPVAGDNFAYRALYKTQAWDGDLTAHTIDPQTGAVNTNTVNWSAQTKLDAKVATAQAGDQNTDGRTIKYFSSSGANKLKEFSLANVTDDGLLANFQNICSKTPLLSQCGSDPTDLSTAQRTIANNAENFIKYLRGIGTYEDKATNPVSGNRIYRGRDHILGDIVNSVPAYVKKPPFNYDNYDTTYAEFKSANATRAGTVFVGANDGMLHAFNSTNGEERWAYVPRMVMRNMWQLADSDYANNHRYMVDGSPTISDFCTTPKSDDPLKCSAANKWRTVIIGGLNKGGCGYYAIDITDPTTPKGLWEFTNANMGYTYGNPVTVKRSDGKWVTIVTSGYNNVPGNGCGSTGDGNGHIYVLDTATGELLDEITTQLNATTPAGTVSTPNGLGRLRAWIEDPALQVAERLYAGDLLGNLWRIDYDNRYPPSGKEAVLLAQLKDRNDNPQPITIRAELGKLKEGGVGYDVVFIATGRYLGVNDLNDTSQQTVYAIKDTLQSTGIGDARDNHMKSRTLSQTTASTGELAGRIIRTITGDSVSWAADNGWYFDLNPSDRSPGERVNINMQLQGRTLYPVGNVPSNNACDVGGSAYLYMIDVLTGKNLQSASNGMAGLFLSNNALAAGITVFMTENGSRKVLITDTAGGLGVEDGGSDTVVEPKLKRTSWREIED
ncbi:type IV pilus assembly protein PilY1 [Paucimonas lemoignei]|uniref:Type IV pilus assembly protein PilY1 n=1 Tax=Paucimonas lemoignei TaxID=29443 RepID=A0A4R3HVC1_PAULE|nr:PilC/PilY family type IV pilus protein [Paucimonas lemoignei]TCS36483.1 type IV pilus assembly protein PilY1 [Paucimonas lemoignei]